MPESYYVHGKNPRGGSWNSKGPMDYERAKQTADGFRRAGYESVMISTKKNPGR